MNGKFPKSVILCIFLSSSLSVLAENFNPTRETVVTSADYSQASDFFESIDLDGTTALIKGRDLNLLDQVYVLERHLGGADRWGLRTSLLPPGTNQLKSNHFSICGDVAAVADVLDDTAGLDAGAIHVFDRNTGGADCWGYVTTITADDAAVGDKFGWKVVTDGDHLAAGVSDNTGVYLFGRHVGGENNWGQVKKFDIPGTNDVKELSVDIHGDTLVVGDRNDPTNEAAYVFRRNEGGEDNWGLIKKLTASDGTTNRLFGFEVGVYEETIVVGAYLDDGLANNSGAAYIYSRNHGGADNWGEVTKVIPTSSYEDQDFGRSLDLVGDTLLIGAAGDDDGGSNAGAAYIFRRNRGGADNWGSTAKLISSVNTDSLGYPIIRGVALGQGVALATTIGDSIGGVDGFRAFTEFICPQWEDVKQAAPFSPINIDDYGASVALNSGYFAVGAPASDVGNVNSGSIEIFGRNEGGADQWDFLVSHNGGDQDDEFGTAMDMFGNTLAVSSPGRKNIIKFNIQTGSVLIHEQNQGGSNAWDSTTEIFVDDGGDGDRFGSAVAGWNHTLIVGAQGSDSNAVEGGAAYIFERNQGGADNWGLITKLNPLDIQATNLFGCAVAIHKNIAAVGANLREEAGKERGAVYLFEQNTGGSNQWGQIQKLNIDGPGNVILFGDAVSLNHNLLAVGVPGYSHADGPIPASGAVYLYGRNLGGKENWGLIKRIEPASPQTNGQFGRAVSFDGDYLAVGEPTLDTGGPKDDRVHLFHRNQGGSDQWGLVNILDEVIPGFDDFGSAVVMNNGRIAVGDTDELAVGSAYLFEPGCRSVHLTNDVVAADDFRGLREAVSEANSSQDAEVTILLGDRTYSLSVAGKSENANVTGDLDYTNTVSKLVIQGQGARNTVIDADDTDRVFHFFDGTTVCLNDLTITDGRPADGNNGLGPNPGSNGENGGGIRNAGTLEINRCHVTFNQAGHGGSSGTGAAGNGGNGGGIHNGGTVTVLSSTFAHNNAGDGGLGGTGGNGGNGGAINTVTTNGVLTVRNSTFHSNDAGEGDLQGASDGNGGAIRVGSLSSVSVRNSTFHDNRAGRSLGAGVTGSGGAINSDAQISPFTFSVFEGNQGDAGSPNVSATAFTAAYNIMDNTNGFIPTGLTLSNRQAAVSLGILANNLGPTDTIEPQPGSLAIDFIDATFGNQAPTDQRGVLRPTSGNTVDAGAVELTDDFDGDGLDDSYEQTFRLDPEGGQLMPGDADKDGVTDQAEYVAFTDWNDPSSFFAITDVQPTNVAAVSFPTVTNRVYAMEYTDNLTNTVWTVHPTHNNLPGTGGILSLTDSNNLPGRLYRIDVSLP